MDSGFAALLEVSDREDAFAAVIRCTAAPEKTDERNRSKWSRLMRYAALYRLEPLERGDGGTHEAEDGLLLRRDIHSLLAT
jgi:hypothetical protein